MPLSGAPSLVDDGFSFLDLGPAASIQQITVDKLKLNGNVGTRLQELVSVYFSTVERSAVLPRGSLDGLRRPFIFEQQKLIDVAVAEGRRAAEQHLASLQSEAAHAKKAADEALRLAQQQQREFATEKTKIEAILDEKWAKLIYVEREQLSSANAVIISLQREVEVLNKTAERAAQQWEAAKKRLEDEIAKAQYEAASIKNSSAKWMSELKAQREIVQSLKKELVDQKLLSERYRRESLECQRMIQEQLVSRNEALARAKVLETDIEVLKVENELHRDLAGKHEELTREQVMLEAEKWQSKLEAQEKRYEATLQQETLTAKKRGYELAWHLGRKNGLGQLGLPLTGSAVALAKPVLGDGLPPPPQQDPEPSSTGERRKGKRSKQLRRSVLRARIDELGLAVAESGADRAAVNQRAAPARAVSASPAGPPQFAAAWLTQPAAGRDVARMHTSLPPRPKSAVPLTGA